jgi:hypothetical protein
METIMSKTNETSKFGDHDTFTDSEFDAVTGGMLSLNAGVITGNPALDAVLKIVAQNLSHGT